MSTAHQHRTARDLSLRMLELINKGEYEKLGEVFTDDAITEWPQTRERVRGLKNGIAIFAAYPGGGDAITENIHFVEGDEGTYLLTPMFTMVKSEGEGETATSTVRTRYPDGSDWYVVTIARARGDKLAHITQYFAPVIEAPEWRSQWVERMED